MIVPTRTLQHPDGRLEVVRVLSAPALKEWTTDGHLAHEGGLMWLLPLDGLDFVRVGTVYNAVRRTGPIILGDGLLVVGYGNLTADAQRHPRTGGYVRRVFYWKPEDLTANMNSPPDGAVDPRTLLPGFEGDAPDVSQVDAGYPRHLKQTPVGEAVARARRTVAVNRPLLCAG